MSKHQVSFILLLLKIDDRVQTIALGYIAIIRVTSAFAGSPDLDLHIEGTSRTLWLEPAAVYSSSIRAEIVKIYYKACSYCEM